MQQAGNGVLDGNTFPDEPLDSKDREIIMTLYKRGAKGAGFNELVRLARPYASRSTVALRTKRLVKLGYLERLRGSTSGRQKPVRLSFRCYALVHTLQKVRSKAADLRSSLQSMAKGTETEERGDASHNAREFKQWYDGFRDGFNGLFGMAGSLAVLYGTSAAGDLFLPLVVDDYKALFSEFASLLRMRQDIMRLIQGTVDLRLGRQGTSLRGVFDEVKSVLLEWKGEAHGSFGTSSARQSI
jgi:DNA-binding Lrp family transcriptional regulator